ncbi:MAG: glycosyltransferase, partial [Culicoidibacterales bacterium]
AKGLPMMYSEIDPDFEGQSFVYKITPDEELIKIDEIIKWYRILQIKSEEISDYAKQFSWDIQMKKVIDIIEEK